jgi:hypothetical protein
MVPLLPYYIVSSIPTIWFPWYPTSWFPSHTTTWFPDTQPVGSHATRRSCHAAPLGVYSHAPPLWLLQDWQLIGNPEWCTRARICKSFQKPRNRFPAWRADIAYDTLFIVPARQATYRLAESIPRNRFLGSLNIYKYGLWVSHCPHHTHSEREIIVFSSVRRSSCILLVKIRTYLHIFSDR